MKIHRIVLGILAAAGIAAAQQYNISTIAGIGQVQGFLRRFAAFGLQRAARITRFWGFRWIPAATTSSWITTLTWSAKWQAPENTCAVPLSALAGDATFGFFGDGGLGVQGEISDVHGLATCNSKEQPLYRRHVQAWTRPQSDSGGFVHQPHRRNQHLRRPTGTYGYSGRRQGSGHECRAGHSLPPLRSTPVAIVYIADFGNYTVRKVDTTGHITTIAGTGTPGNSGDGGPANKAQLASPYALAIDAQNNIYISDLGNSNIREVTTDGNIHTVVSGVSTDSIAIDAAGSIYFADSFTHTVRKILSGGTQFIIAGIPGNPGFSGDGGPGTNAQLNQPHGVALDASGNVYVADGENMVIRLLTPVTSSISVASAASGNGVSISPGEIVNMFGTGGLGPATPVSAAPANGFYPKQLAGTTVSFNGTPAVVIYTSATQVSAIVPYSMPIGGAANVTVTFGGQSYTTADALPIAAAASAIFTAYASGIGQVAAINQNNTINSMSTPAPEGTIISLYLTGEGLTSPAGVDGKITTKPFPTPVMGVIVAMNGQNAPVTYAGEAPGLVAGVMQVNALIPNNLLSTPTTLPVAVPVVVTVGVVSSQANATISVIQ